MLARGGPCFMPLPTMAGLRATPRLPVPWGRAVTGTEICFLGLGASAKQQFSSAADKEVKRKMKFISISFLVLSDLCQQS